MRRPSAGLLFPPSLFPLPICGAHNASLLQCVITAPRRCSPQDNTLLSDDQTGDLRLRNMGGTTVIFDSFSSAEDVRRRNPLSNSISRLNDPSRHFLAGFSVSVTGPVAAILSTDTVEEYQRVEKRPRAPPVVQRSTIITDFDLEIERRKRQCALLFRDTSVSLSNSPSTIVSMAETLLSMREAATFADVLRGNPSERPHTRTTEETAAISALCAFRGL
jgi:hypothetical protein